MYDNKNREREKLICMNNNNRIKYRDIINLPHHVSLKHPHMAVRDRAAQFAPFAALTGHDKAMKETAEQMQKIYDR